MAKLAYLKSNKGVHYFIENNSGSYPQANLFTILIGKNSTGKSRLLRSIIIHSLDEENNAIFNRVIAISNTQYHKFPRSRELPKSLNILKYIKIAFSTGSFESFNINGIVKDHKFYTRASYLLSELKVPVLNYFSSRFNILSIFDIFMVKSTDSKATENLKKILNFLKLDRDIRIQLRRTSLMNKEDVISGSFAERVNKYLSLDIIELNRDVLVRIDYLLTKYAKKNQLINISLFESTQEDLNDISDLISLGLLRIKDLHFFKNYSKLSYKDLSSGELSVLSLAISLITSLADESLICIDEPELNLHPEWQGKIVDLIQLVSEDFSGCHFFIATHSPLIVSNLDSDNSYILDLQTGRLRSSSEMNNRSSDYQLSEVFNYPGINNEYLIRKMVLILNKINSTDDPLTYGERVFVDNIGNLIVNGNIGSQDKVKFLYDIFNYR